MNYAKLFTTTSLFLILCIPQTVVHAESQPSANFAECMDNVDLGAFKNTQWASCAAAEIERQDVILNAEYKKLKNSLSSEQKGFLTKAQKSWLKFREDWCRFEEDGPTGLVGAAGYNLCIMEITNKQIDAIKGLQQ